MEESPSSTVWDGKITGIRFGLATCQEIPGYCLNAYTGHPSHVMSLDFHPKKNDLFCFCDSNNEIRYWNISPFTCARVSKQGGSAQVRFQPISAHLLAATSHMVVSIFDVETDRQTHEFQGTLEW